MSFLLLLILHYSFDYNDELATVRSRNYQDVVVLAILHLHLLPVIRICLPINVHKSCPFTLPDGYWRNEEFQFLVLHHLALYRQSWPPPIWMCVFDKGLNRATLIWTTSITGNEVLFGCRSVVAVIQIIHQDIMLNLWQNGLDCSSLSSADIQHFIKCKYDCATREIPYISLSLLAELITIHLRICTLSTLFSWLFSSLLYGPVVVAQLALNW